MSEKVIDGMWNAGFRAMPARDRAGQPAIAVCHGDHDDDYFGLSVDQARQLATTLVQAIVRSVAEQRGRAVA